tara:strand:- start:325027 stop:325335 length:309 start_codon:yes stop_codon:yes gene_type:complete
MTLSTHFSKTVNKLTYIVTHNAFGSLGDPGIVYAYNAACKDFLVAAEKVDITKDANVPSANNTDVKYAAVSLQEAMDNDQVFDEKQVSFLAKKLVNMVPANI